MSLLILQASSFLSPAQFPGDFFSHGERLLQEVKIPGFNN